MPLARQRKHYNVLDRAWSDQDPAPVETDRLRAGHCHVIQSADRYTNVKDHLRRDPAASAETKRKLKRVRHATWCVLVSLVNIIIFLIGVIVFSVLAVIGFIIVLVLSLIGFLMRLAVAIGIGCVHLCRTMPCC